MQQGYLDKIGQKQGMGRNGPYTSYSINVGGQWYNCGFKPPAANEGDYIQFDLVQKGQYTNAQNIAVSPQQAAQAAPQQQQQGVINKAPAGPLPVNKKDVSIHYQSCRKDAINIVSTLLDHEALALPAKKADKMDAALAVVEELTNQFYLKLEDVIAEGGVKLEDAIPEPGDA